MKLTIGVNTAMPPIWGRHPILLASTDARMWYRWTRDRRVMGCPSHLRILVEVSRCLGAPARLNPDNRGSSDDVAT